MSGMPLSTVLLTNDIFWAVTEGVIASVLLLAGGLKALQTAAIASGFPFALIMVGMCFAFLKELKKEF